ncbi:MAG: CU044_2847 family protein [Microcoleaceae cyanobacterium]
MVQLTPIQLEDGTTIYIEATENINIPVSEPSQTNESLEVENPREKGFFDNRNQSLRDRLEQQTDSITQEASQSFQAIENTIKAYTTFTLNAFKQIAVANIEEVTLEFGVEVGGEAGVPYVTKGTAKSNLKITVKCSFPSEELGG